jgi:hypothetical protein
LQSSDALVNKMAIPHDQQRFILAASPSQARARDAQNSADMHCGRGGG